MESINLVLYLQLNYKYRNQTDAEKNYKVKKLTKNLLKSGTISGTSRNIAKVLHIKHMAS